jgi:acetyl esterase/lipase
MNRGPARAAWLTACLLVLATAVSAEPHERHLLYPDRDLPNAGSRAGYPPGLWVYRPDADRNTGTAVVVFPGGGYGGLALGHEGEAIGQWLIGHGITAFVLIYRHGPENGHPIPLTDARRGVQWVRANAETYGVDPGRVGVLGFSAGGHLTATAGTQFVDADPGAADPLERHSSRPDFIVPVYPVITMLDPWTHAGSRRNLLGESPTEEQMRALSAELQVTKRTPPTFLVHTTQDTVVPVANATLFYSALVAHGVPVEMHIFERGHHGLGLGNAANPEFAAWPDLCLAWMRVHGFLPAK